MADIDEVEKLDALCKAVRTDATDSLKNDEVYDYLANTENIANLLITQFTLLLNPMGAVFLYLI